MNLGQKILAGTVGVLCVVVVMWDFVVTGLAPSPGGWLFEVWVADREIGFTVLLLVIVGVGDAARRVLGLGGDGF